MHHRFALPFRLPCRLPSRPPRCLPPGGTVHGYILFESLCGLAIFTAGLASLAILGPTGLGWQRALDQASHDTRRTAEWAELAPWPAGSPLNRAGAELP
ncbi:hypothetical protein [Cupriavidus oxalaticus]|uniref:Uncharacterized protein n=1 Tax=Cupriavidus oxalaticus TaxID=96344 RepID=A0A375G619_9BURK|nr:hypothetical protein [Cupriavidus oxalaticus]QRQ88213.1 hypothetical protein JTE91_16625 [Cupriavidus oxalaticus]QRQ93460.1 hypothetical protein JTE92_25635 [Cupriavidus oxalaticus]WQD82083.1 hypothetical protein U0036_13380 [Cupriavidus oxalaticus]SPC14177.1 hypothetical protein CO2235_200033 [Cupriavidus oxalaticus]